MAKSTKPLVSNEGADLNAAPSTTTEQLAPITDLPPIPDDFEDGDDLPSQEQQIEQPLEEQKEEAPLVEQKQEEANNEAPSHDLTVSTSKPYSTEPLTETVTEDEAVDLHPNLPRIKVEYPENYTGVRYFIDGSVHPVSPEVAAHLIELGIAKEV